ncbi:PDC sensor domain-containing protein [Deferrisoma sp.]
MGLPAKLILSFLVLALAPIGVMTALSLGHLRTIQVAAVEETRALLISAQMNRVTEKLGQESERLAGGFRRLADEVHVLRRFVEHVVAGDGALTGRNGSVYALASDGSFGNFTDDGNSVLFVPRFRPALLPLVRRTEVFDLVARPLVEREERIVLAWMILRDGITRAYPWRDFGGMPRDKDYTTWPFYYLADPDHNPGRGEVFTDLYLDPLSHEWMISCLSPAYVGGSTSPPWGWTSPWTSCSGRSGRSGCRRGRPRRSWRAPGSWRPRATFPLRTSAWIRLGRPTARTCPPRPWPR